MAPDDEKAVWINQDAWFSLANLSKEGTTEYTIRKNGNGVYVFVLTGNITIGDQVLSQRDGLGISETDSIQILANTDAEFLLIDIPMKITGE